MTYRVAAYTPVGDFWSDLLETVTKIPIVGKIAGLFQKDKITAEQQAILAGLPEPYLSMAIGELENSANAKEEFDSIYNKYVAMWEADIQAAEKKKMQLLWFGVAGAVGIAAIVTILVVASRRRK